MRYCVCIIFDFSLEVFFFFLIIYFFFFASFFKTFYLSQFRFSYSVRNVRYWTLFFCLLLCLLYKVEIKFSVDNQKEITQFWLWKNCVKRKKCWAPTKFSHENNVVLKPRPRLLCIKNDLRHHFRGSTVKSSSRSIQILSFWEHLIMKWVIRAYMSVNSSLSYLNNWSAVN